MTNEMMQKAKACKSAEELLALAKENNIEMTAEEAAEKYAQLRGEGELSEDELASAAGGGCGESRRPVEIGTRFCLDSGYRCPSCGYEYATVKSKEDRPMHGGSITWYDFECEGCKHMFSMCTWHGTELNG